MKHLLIIGASGFGRELESWLSLLPGFGSDFIIQGYLDKNNNALVNFESAYKVIGDEDTFAFHEDNLCIVAIADPKTKKRITDKLIDKVEFFNYVAPNSIIGHFNHFGKGCIICPNVVISTNVLLGDFVTINIGTQIGHDTIIGNYSTINANTDIAGKCKIGNSVLVGSHAFVLQEIKIGDNAIVGVGSTVIRDIQSNVTVFGNPARKIF